MASSPSPRTRSSTTRAAGGASSAGIGTEGLSWFVTPAPYRGPAGRHDRPACPRTWCVTFEHYDPGRGRNPAGPARRPGRAGPRARRSSPIVSASRDPQRRHRAGRRRRDRQDVAARRRRRSRPPRLGQHVLRLGVSEAEPTLPWAGMVSLQPSLPPAAARPSWPRCSAAAHGRGPRRGRARRWPAPVPTWPPRSATCCGRWPASAPSCWPSTTCSGSIRRRPARWRWRSAAAPSCP